MPTEEQTYREGVKKDLQEIKALVTYTNGKVRSLLIWRAYIVGFCACITIIILPVMFILLAHYFPQV